MKTFQSLKLTWRLAAYSVAGLLATVSLSSTAAAATPLVSKASGLCLDLPGFNSEPGPAIDIWGCNGGSNQQWDFTAAGELRTLDGSRCLDASGGGTTNGTKVISYPCTGGANQKWTYSGNGAVVAQSGLCLDVIGGATTNGSVVALWGCNGGNNQIWTKGSGGCTASIWTRGVNYPLGAVVKYTNGNYYKVVNAGANGSDGTDPLVSAWYWQPTTCGSTGTPAPAPADALSPTYRGEVTFYDANGEGNCSFDATPNNLLVAAISTTDYAGSAACGEFITVTGPKGKVTVRITDRCEGCKPGDVDLSQQAFEKIANVDAGRAPISWHVIPADVSGPIAFRYKEGSTRWWLGIQVLNHRLPVTKLEIRPNGSNNWINVQRLNYNYFVHPSTIAEGPLQVRVTGLGGATLLQNLPEPSDRPIIQGTGQFP